jgi:hypothetical protein
MVTRGVPSERRLLRVAFETGLLLFSAGARGVLTHFIRENLVNAAEQSAG